MDVAIGRAPPLTDGQMQGRLRHEAHELLAEFREHNKQVRSGLWITGWGNCRSPWRAFPGRGIAVCSACLACNVTSDCPSHAFRLK